MKNIKPIHTAAGILIFLFIIAGAFLLNSCAPSKAVAEKTGAELWAENCQRCHNTPSPASYSSDQWVTIGLHMQSRALLTDGERDKIIAFLQMSR